MIKYLLIFPALAILVYAIDRIIKVIKKRRQKDSLLNHIRIKTLDIEFKDVYERLHEYHRQILSSMSEKELIIFMNSLEPEVSSLMNKTTAINKELIVNDLVNIVELKLVQNVYKRDNS